MICFKAVLDLPRVAALNICEFTLGDGGSR